jgi:hypothetical protein
MDGFSNVMKTNELIEKYFKKKDHQVVVEKLNNFYDDVATGLKIAKQSPSSKKKVKSTALNEKKKLTPLIKGIDKVLYKLKDVRFIGFNSIDAEHQSLLGLKEKATKVLNYPKQSTNYASQRIEGWVFDLIHFYEKYNETKAWVSNNDYTSNTKWTKGALFVRDALNIIEPIPDFTIHTAIVKCRKTSHKVKK